MAIKYDPLWRNVPLPLAIGGSIVCGLLLTLISNYENTQRTKSQTYQQPQEQATNYLAKVDTNGTPYFVPHKK